MQPQPKWLALQGNMPPQIQGTSTVQYSTVEPLPMGSNSTSKVSLSQGLTCKNPQKKMERDRIHRTMHILPMTPAPQADIAPVTVATLARQLYPQILDKPCTWRRLVASGGFKRSSCDRLIRLPHRVSDPGKTTDV